ncbi:ste kinase, partial [Cystoisospora suis]
MAPEVARLGLQAFGRLKNDACSDLSSNSKSKNTRNRSSSASSSSSSLQKHQGKTGSAIGGGAGGKGGGAGGCGGLPNGYDCRVDIWSLGITAYESAVGTLPWPRRMKLEDLLMTILEGSPPRINLNEGFEKTFCFFVEKCLRKNPQESMVSYFFWVGLIYFIGAVVLVTGFQYTSPRVATVIACPMQSSVYLMIGAWLVQSFVFFFTCWGYATISSAGKKDSLAEFDRSGGPGGAAGGAAGGRGGGGARPPDEAQAEGVYMADDLKFDRLTTGLSILGVFVKTVPTWIRLLHVFNMCQFIVWLIDLLLLPECNASGLRWIIGNSTS